ncbi:hypothetical protein DPMN_137242 [Dreissena polymorpha]|uniref:Uncharacterized protein n=1 Tax=Dreissena polymorpha TaxID=45954 RepID=A0A9D4G1I8_DREPO|nr:hypothetical protein DPMN_137242 [Dreissena polymorpha]
MIIKSHKPRRGYIGVNFIGPCSVSSSILAIKSSQRSSNNRCSSSRTQYINNTGAYALNYKETTIDEIKPANQKDSLLLQLFTPVMQKKLRDINAV